MNTFTTDTSLPLSSQGETRQEAYEPPMITTYTEAELLAALGPAHAGVSPGYGLMNELLGIPEEPEW